jgi:hypothetical protein
VNPTIHRRGAAAPKTILTLLAALTSAPSRTSISTIVPWPLWAATWRGAHEQSCGQSQGQVRQMSVNAHTRHAEGHAVTEHPSPVPTLFVAFTSAPARTSSSTIFSSPMSTAHRSGVSPPCSQKIKRQSAQSVSSSLSVAPDPQDVHA